MAATSCSLHEHAEQALTLNCHLQPGPPSIGGMHPELATLWSRHVCWQLVLQRVDSANLSLQHILRLKADASSHCGKLRLALPTICSTTCQQMSAPQHCRQSGAITWTSGCSCLGCEESEQSQAQDKDVVFHTSAVPELGAGVTAADWNKPPSCCGGLLGKPALAEAGAEEAAGEAAAQGKVAAAELDACGSRVCQGVSVRTAAPFRSTACCLATRGCKQHRQGLTHSR